MIYHCIHCNQNLKRSQVERFPNQPVGTHYRKHIDCSRGDAYDGHGTAIPVGVSNESWTDGEDDIPWQEWIKDH